MKISRGEFATRIPFAKKKLRLSVRKHRKWSFDESPGPPEAAKNCPKRRQLAKNSLPPAVWLPYRGGWKLRPRKAPGVTRHT